eukprot:6178281-Pleurochrysis_carterae.AAC.1
MSHKGTGQRPKATDSKRGSCTARGYREMCADPHLAPRQEAQRWRNGDALLLLGSSRKTAGSATE